MSGIDYSKWDHLDEYSDDDDEQQDNEGSSPSPQVTQLDAPSRVTFGGGSAEITAQSTVSTGVTSTGRPIAIDDSDIDTNTSKWIQDGGFVTTETGHKLFWSQDRYAVTFRLALDDLVKASDLKVQVEGMLPYSDRHCAVGSTKPILQIMITPTTTSAATETPLLRGDLPHPIHWAREDDEEKVMDWSIEREQHSGGSSADFLVFTLYKAVPMHGMFVWWRRPLLSFPEVDVPAASSSSTNTTSNTSQEFSQAWEEAHRLFREKRASQPQQEVP